MSKIKFFILFLGLIAVLESTHTLFINLTPSIPTGLYIRQFMGELKKGDVVVYRPNQLALDIGLENGYIKSSQELFIKNVGLVGGGSYSIDSETRAFVVDGRHVGESLEFDSNGRMMPFSPGTYQLHDDEFLPVGTADRSFDGRYTGPVPRENIVCKVVPLIIFDIP